MGIHVWYIYPPLYRLIFMVNVGKIPFVPWILWASNALSHTKIPPSKQRSSSLIQIPRGRRTVHEHLGAKHRGLFNWPWKGRVENRFTA